MEDRKPGPARVAPDAEQELWRQLAEASSAQQFCFAWLALQAAAIGGVTGGQVILERAGDFQAVATWPAAYPHPERLATALKRSVSERQGIVARPDGGAETLVMAYPVRVGPRVQGAAAFEISPRPQAQLLSGMQALQWGAAWLHNWILRGVAPGERPSKRLATVLELAGRALEEETFRGAAMATLTELASRLDCDRVSVGFLRGKHVKVAAVSHSAQFGKAMNLIRDIGTAMEESVDQQAVLVFPPDGKRRQYVLQAQERLARAHQDQAVLTMPFVDHDGKAFGALTFERSVDEPFDDSTIELCDSVAALLGPILDEKRRNDRLLVRKIGDSLMVQVRRLFGPRYAVRKLVAAGFVVLVVFFAFARGAYRIRAKTTLEGEVRRVVTAPFKGFVHQAPVRSGDIVRAGATMCQLDVRDLEVEYSKWSTEREQHSLEHRRAMAQGDRAGMNVFGKKMGQAQAQARLLEEQIARATIVAPFDGIVVSGDLSQALGSPVEAGAILFEVAPLESYRLKLEVDERNIDEIREGQRGRLVLTSMPEDALPFAVTKITPVSRSEEGRNYFAVEGRLDRISERLRPGMEGFAKVDVERRRLIWIWTHDLVDWLRVRLWKWLP